MTTPMEVTVRPFAQVPIHPDQTTLPARVPAEVIDCHLGGEGGTTTSFSLGGLKIKVINRNETFKESGRKSTNVRVENPDDSSQFVEFCRADSVSLTSKNDTPTQP